MSGSRARAQRRAHTLDEKRAAVLHLQRLHPSSDDGSAPPAWAMKQVAKIHGVCTRTLYRWWDDRQDLVEPPRVWWRL